MTVTADNGAFCPIPSEALRRRRLRNGTYRITDCGLEKRCTRCKDHWPADTEFFYSVPSHVDGLNSWCKACYRSWRRGQHEQLQEETHECAAG